MIVVATLTLSTLDSGPSMTLKRGVRRSAPKKRPPLPSLEHQLRMLLEREQELAAELRCMEQQIEALNDRWEPVESSLWARYELMKEDYWALRRRVNRLHARLPKWGQCDSDF